MSPCFVHSEPRCSVCSPRISDTPLLSAYQCNTSPLELDKWRAEDRLVGATDGVRYILVELMTLWSPPSQFFAPEFAALSLKYQTEGVRYCKIDVERYAHTERAFAFVFCVSIPHASLTVPFDTM